MNASLELRVVRREDTKYFFALIERVIILLVFEVEKELPLAKGREDIFRHSSGQTKEAKTKQTVGISFLLVFLVENWTDL